MDKPNFTFNPEEKFILENFIKVHSGKSWFACKKDDSTIDLLGTKSKKVLLKKSSDTAFDVEISSGVQVVAHIHWQASLVQLLMRMEAELFDNSLVIK